MIKNNNHEIGGKKSHNNPLVIIKLLLSDTCNEWK